MLREFNCVRNNMRRRSWVETYVDAEDVGDRSHGY
jgi:hypothetical protein